MDLIEVKNRKEGIIVRHPWEQARVKVVNKLLSRVLKDEIDFNVLDIGCGDIYFISSLSDMYPEVNFYAIDIAFTDEIIERLKKEAGTRKIFLFKSLEEAEKKMNGKADLVLLLDVVEHIEKDVGFLSSLCKNSLFTNETHMMITVPAYQSLFCSHDHFLGHYKRYTNSTLIDTIQKSGFSKIRAGYFFISLIPPRILQVLKEKIMKPDLKNETTGLVEWNKGKGITSLITNFLLTDFYITDLFKKGLGINIPGLSNYIICKKRQ